MSDTVPYENVTIESIDRAIKDWFDRSVDVRVKSPNGELKKVSVIFSQGERWSVGRSRQTFRDENGVLILPVISIRRTSMDLDASMSALGVQTDSIRIARRLDPKTMSLHDLEQLKVNGMAKTAIYDTFTIPYPDRMLGHYQLIVQAQYVQQMNDILQKIWKELDIQRSFVAPIHNDGKRASKANQGEGSKFVGPYVVGFFKGTMADSGNFDEFTDTERVVKYTADLVVPFNLVTQPEGEPAAVKIKRSAYKLVLGDEQTHFVENQAELDKIFGSTHEE